MNAGRFSLFPSVVAGSLVAGLLLFTLPRACPASSVDQGQVATSVARLLEQMHYTRQKLDDRISEQFLENYLRLLDYQRMYFLQSDVDEFAAKYGTSLDDAMLRGDVQPGIEIFERFRERVKDRVGKNLEMIKEPFAFTSNREVEIDRRKAAWPRDAADADRLWRNRIEHEMLQEKLSEAPIDPPEKVLTRRYNQVMRNVTEQEEEDILKTFFTALANTYDPHSDYLSPSDMENFSISMRLSLVGVGAVLRSDDGYAQVMEVVPGGPADRDGRLRVNDRIVAVAQGSKEFEDVVDMKLDKVVERIRGKKGSTVKLLVIPANATDPSKREVIEIVRDEVKLKDQEARAELIEMPGERTGEKLRVGWITLPSFYANMDRGPGTSPKSTTADVSRLLKRLTAEGIDGLVIDLRRDGGGSLEEAINLTGLFIPEGPVVQVKNANGQVTVNSDKNPSTLYNGPMVVLMNRLSASASEIFAAALQDYGRAVIVGDERSFGKGTVQQLIDVGRVMPFFSLAGADAGSLKLTVQKFYRVKGGSTQLKGVESDIVLPSLTDSPEIGEGALPGPLQYDEVDPRPLMAGVRHPAIDQISFLRERSASRAAGEPEFQYIKEDMQRIRDRIAANRISLNYTQRKEELAAEKSRKEERIASRKERGPALAASAFEITIDNAEDGELIPVAFERETKKSYLERDPDESEPADSEESADGEKKEKPPEPDAVRVEALNILRDMVSLGAPAGKTASARGEAAAKNP